MTRFRHLLGKRKLGLKAFFAQLRRKGRYEIDRRLIRGLQWEPPELRAQNALASRDQESPKRNRLIVQSTWSNNTMEIRPVKHDDRDEWARMRARLYPDLHSHEIDDWFEVAEQGGTHLVGIAVFVVDRGNGSLAGFVEIGSRNYAEGCETTPVAFLEGWYVDPDIRKAGLGSRLVQAAETWAVACGFR